MAGLFGGMLPPPPQRKAKQIHIAVDLLQFSVLYDNGDHKTNSDPYVSKAAMIAAVKRVLDNET